MTPQRVILDARFHRTIEKNIDYSQNPLYSLIARVSGSGTFLEVKLVATGALLFNVKVSAIDPNLPPIWDPIQTGTGTPVISPFYSCEIDKDKHLIYPLFVDISDENPDIYSIVIDYVDGDHILTLTEKSRSFDEEKKSAAPLTLRIRYQKIPPDVG